MKKNTFNTTVPIESDKLRIDKFLQLKLKELSRTKLQEEFLREEPHQRLTPSFPSPLARVVPKDVRNC